MKDNELIVCRDVSLGYEGKSVLTDLDLTIAKGDYLCVVGDLSLIHISLMPS